MQRWDSTAWTAQTPEASPPAKSRDEHLSGVPCTSATACTAVGFRQVQDQPGPLAVRSR
jgi:hypothetical protein